jgi:hypothetical protein
MTVKQVDKLIIMSLTSLITMKSFGCDDIKMYEMEFIEMAKSPVKYRWFETLQLKWIFWQVVRILIQEMITMLQESNDEKHKRWFKVYSPSENIHNDVTAEVMNEKARKVL